MSNTTKSIFASALAIPLLLSAPGAHAAEGVGSGFYGTVFAGANFASDVDFSGNIGGAPQSVENEYEDGFVVGGALGKAWGPIGGFGVRTEVELSHRQNDVDEIFFSGNGPAAEINVDGDSSSTTLFANVLVDLPLSNIPVTPFAGFGLGVAFTEQDFVYGPGVRVGDSDEAFAAQLIGGASYDISDRFAVTLDGRYQRAFGVESRRLAPTGDVTGIVEDDISSFSVNLGLRVKF